MSTERFGGRDPEGRRLGNIEDAGEEAGRYIPASDEEVVDLATRRAALLVGEGKEPVVLPYANPKQRARRTFERTAKAVAAALVLALAPIFLEYLRVGRYDKATLVTLGAAVATGLLTLAFSTALKYNAAREADPYDPYPARGTRQEGAP